MSAPCPPGTQSQACCGRSQRCPEDREVPGANTPQTHPKPKALKGDWSHPGHRGGWQPSCHLPILAPCRFRGQAILPLLHPASFPCPPALGMGTEMMLPLGGSCARAQGRPSSRAECSLHCLPRAGAATPVCKRISDFSFRLRGNGASRDYTVLLGRGKPCTAAASLPALGIEGEFAGDTEMGGAANCRQPDRAESWVHL